MVYNETGVVVCQVQSYTEEPYDERVTYGSVGVVACKGGLYPENDGFSVA